jgi:archaetidylinositol phosphate synthase
MQYLEPVAGFFARAGVTPNQLSFLALLLGICAAVAFATRNLIPGSLLLFLSALLDLVDGGVARRTGRQSDFGAVFDWIVDKYVDAIAILGAGLSGAPILSFFFIAPPGAEVAVMALAIIGSLMNTFIKPVVYAEIGYKERVGGKIEDPLEGVGFFGRPETLIVLIIGGLSGFIGVAVLLIAICTNLSAMERILYLYRRYRLPPRDGA